MTTGEAILLSVPGLLLAVYAVAALMRRRAVAAFVALQKQRATLCVHGKARAECFYCIDGGREDLVDEDEGDDEEDPPYVPAQPVALPGVLPIRFDSPLDYVRFEIHTDRTCPGGQIDVGVLWANGVVDHFQLCAAALTSQVCCSYEEFRRPIKALFLRLVPGVTRIKVLSAGRLFIDSDPQTLALIGGAA